MFRMVEHCYRSVHDLSIYFSFFFCIFYMETRSFVSRQRKIHRTTLLLIIHDDIYRIGCMMCKAVYHLVDAEVTRTVNFHFVRLFVEVLTRKWKLRDSKARRFRINFQITC